MDFKTAQNDVLNEIAAIENNLALLKARVSSGQHCGHHCMLEVGQLNFLLGKYALLSNQQKKTEPKQPAATKKGRLMSVPELLEDHKNWENQRRKQRNK